MWTRLALQGQGAMGSIGRSPIPPPRARTGGTKGPWISSRLLSKPNRSPLLLSTDLWAFGGGRMGTPGGERGKVVEEWDRERDGGLGRSNCHQQGVCGQTPAAIHLQGVLLRGRGLLTPAILRVAFGPRKFQGFCQQPRSLDTCSTLPTRQTSTRPCGNASQRCFAMPV